MTKYCPGCGETKPAHKFYSDDSHKDGLRTYCKTCTSKATSRRYRAEGLIPRCPNCGGIDYFTKQEYPDKIFCCRCAKSEQHTPALKAKKSLYMQVKKDTERLTV